VDNSKRCKDCRRILTWAERRRQYGRLLRRGLTEEQVKGALPRCQKCMTVWLQPNNDEHGGGDRTDMQTSATNA